MGYLISIWLALQQGLAKAEELAEVRRAYGVAWSGSWEELRQLMRSPYAAVRYWAAKAVRYRANPPTNLIEAVAPLTRDADPVVAVAAAAALAHHGKGDLPDVRQAFLRALRHGQPGVRLEALTFLRELPALAAVFRDEYRSTLALGRQMPSEVQKLCTELLERTAEPDR